MSGKLRFLRRVKEGEWETILQEWDEELFRFVDVPMMWTQEAADLCEPHERPELSRIALDI